MIRFVTAASAAILVATTAYAQTTTSPAAPTATAPMAGANSFTEAQAKDRIEKAGYTGVGALTKDADGVWHSTAMKGGSQVNVNLDFKGNVVEK